MIRTSVVYNINSPVVNRRNVSYDFTIYPVSSTRSRGKVSTTSNGNVHGYHLGTRYLVDFNRFKATYQCRDIDTNFQNISKETKVQRHVFTVSIDLVSIETVENLGTIRFVPVVQYTM